MVIFRWTYYLGGSGGIPTWDDVLCAQYEHGTLCEMVDDMDFPDLDRLVPACPGLWLA